MNNNVLVVKLSPLNGLNSSMMRTLALIKGLMEAGYDVEMLTIKESSTTVLNDISRYGFLKNATITYANNNATYDRIVSNNIGVKRKVVGLLRKIYHTFSVFDYTYGISKATSISKLSNRRYKYVISVSDPKPAHIAMRNLIRQGLSYEKWIEYWGDPMAIDITNKSIYPKFVYKIIEKKLFDKCDSLVYTSPFTVEEQKTMYPNYAAKMKYVPTAYIEKKLIGNHSGKYTVGYYGAYNSYVRNIMPLYEACAQMDDIQLTIVGNSDLTLEEKKNISIHPRGNIDQYEQDTDLFVCVLNATGTQIPGKAYHYAATNKPVLIILDGERKEDLRRFFEKFNRYEICENSVEEITRAIRSTMVSKRVVNPCEEFSCVSVAERLVE